MSVKLNVILLYYFCVYSVQSIPAGYQNLHNKVVDGNSNYWPYYLGLVFIVTGIVFLVGCLECCRQRAAGFKEFRNNNSEHDANGGVDLGFVNPLQNVFQNSSDLAVYPPFRGNSQQPESIITFEPLPHVVPQHRFTNPPRLPLWNKTPGSDSLSIDDWFGGKNADFSRQQLHYVRECGQGWFGKVVEGDARGILPPSNKVVRVYVRILREDASSMDQALFLHEAKPYRDLAHPNILKLLGRCLENAPFLLVFESCSNGDLKSYLKRNAHNRDALVAQGATLRMAADIASGLNYMLRNGFVHTDVAARNCLVTSDLRVKIGDYGISIETYKEEYYCTGDVALPIRWCAPETLKFTDTTIETKQVTGSSCVWSYGVLLWELEEWGELPYKDLTDDQIILKVFGDEAVRLSLPSYRIPYSHYIYNIMEECWKPEPDRPSFIHIISAVTTLLHKFKNNDFEYRWQNMKPNCPSTGPLDDKISPRRDSDSGIDTETPRLRGGPLQTSHYNCSNSSPTSSRRFSNSSTGDLFSSSFSSLKQKSPSLENLHGSLDNLGGRTAATAGGVVEFQLGPVSNDFSGRDWNKPLFPPDSFGGTDDSITKRGGGIGSGYGDSLTDQEDEIWRKRIERGEFTEKVKEKSKSVADLMILTHIDCSESSESDSLPSLTRQSSFNKFLKKIGGSGKATNAASLLNSLNFGSESNLPVVEKDDEFQETLKKIQAAKINRDEDSLTLFSSCLIAAGAVPATVSAPLASGSQTSTPAPALVSAPKLLLESYSSSPLKAGGFNSSSLNSDNKTNSSENFSNHFLGDSSLHVGKEIQIGDFQQPTCNEQKISSPKNCLEYTCLEKNSFLLQKVETEPPYEASDSILLGPSENYTLEYFKGLKTTSMDFQWSEEENYGEHEFLEDENDFERKMTHLGFSIKLDEPSPPPGGCGCYGDVEIGSNICGGFPSDDSGRGTDQINSGDGNSDKSLDGCISEQMNEVKSRLENFVFDEDRSSCSSLLEDDDEFDVDEEISNLQQSDDGKKSDVQSIKSSSDESSIKTILSPKRGELAKNFILEKWNLANHTIGYSENHSIVNSDNHSIVNLENHSIVNLENNEFNSMNNSNSDESVVNSENNEFKWMNRFNSDSDESSIDDNDHCNRFEINNDILSALRNELLEKLPIQSASSLQLSSGSKPDGEPNCSELIPMIDSSDADCSSEDESILMERLNINIEYSDDRYSKPLSPIIEEDEDYNSSSISSFCFSSNNSITCCASELEDNLQEIINLDDDYSCHQNQFSSNPGTASRVLNETYDLEIIPDVLSDSEDFVDNLETDDSLKSFHVDSVSEASSKTGAPLSYSSSESGNLSDVFLSPSSSKNFEDDISRENVDEIINNRQYSNDGLKIEQSIKIDSDRILSNENDNSNKIINCFEDSIPKRKICEPSIKIDELIKINSDRINSSENDDSNKIIEYFEESIPIEKIIEPAIRITIDDLNHRLIYSDYNLTENNNTNEKSIMEFFDESIPVIDEQKTEQSIIIDLNNDSIEPKIEPEIVSINNHEKAVRDIDSLVDQKNSNIDLLCNHVTSINQCSDVKDDVETSKENRELWLKSYFLPYSSSAGGAIGGTRSLVDFSGNLIFNKNSDDEETHSLPVSINFESGYWPKVEELISMESKKNVENSSVKSDFTNKNLNPFFGSLENVLNNDESFKNKKDFLLTPPTTVPVCIFTNNKSEKFDVNKYKTNLKKFDDILTKNSFNNIFLNNRDFQSENENKNSENWQPTVMVTKKACQDKISTPPGLTLSKLFSMKNLENYGLREIEISNLKNPSPLSKFSEIQSNVSDDESDGVVSVNDEFIWEKNAPISAKIEKLTDQDEEEMDSGETSDDSSCSGEEEDGADFTPSSWNSSAMPNKSALKSPEKKMKLKKTVSFKKQKYHCVYEYPKEECHYYGGDSLFNHRQTINLWNFDGSPASCFPDYSMFSDWELDDCGPVEPCSTEDDYADFFKMATQTENVKSPTRFYTISNFYDYDTSGSSIANDLLIENQGHSLNTNRIGSKNDMSNNDVGSLPILINDKLLSDVEDLSQPLAEISDSNEDLNSPTTMMREMGELRHTKDKLKLDFNSSSSSEIDFTTTDKSRISSEEDPVSDSILDFDGVDPLSLPPPPPATVYASTSVA